MVYREEGDCVGCEHCIKCGRDKPYWVFECDICGSKFYDENKVEHIKGKDYCKHCLEELEEQSA